MSLRQSKGSQLAMPVLSRYDALLFAVLDAAMNGLLQNYRKKLRRGEKNMQKREEDTLRKLWVKIQENNEIVEKEAIDDEILEALGSKELIKEVDGILQLTEKGNENASHLVRLYRLAERLLSDVLKMENMELDTPSCQFEHKVPSEVEEAICTLLGHPTICPHGHPIPQGKCCKVEREEISRIIYDLTELRTGANGKIAYIQFDGRETLRKLLSRGVNPGKSIKVLQTFPSYVFQVGETQIAVDEHVAKGIFVLREKEATEKAHEREKKRRRRRFLHF